MNLLYVELNLTITIQPGRCIFNKESPHSLDIQLVVNL